MKTCVPDEEIDPPILTLVGPTAVGKTSLSLALAQQLNAEIISADSRQVYEELTIGTAKPSPSELAQAPHHFIGERSVEGPPFSAGAFADAANARIREIRDRGKQAIVVGGSTLYVHALQEGLADIPDVPTSVREELSARLENEGPEALYAELQEVDPTQAEKNDPTKTQRVIRALEVYHHTGKPLTHFYENQPEPPFSYRTVVLNRDRQKLYDRINRRVDQMLDAGLLDEVREVMELDVNLDEAPLSTIGYREPIQHLRGDINRDEMIRLVKRNSRRYAKRQLTWFRRYDDYVWLEADGAAPEDVFDAVAFEPSVR
ncbi:tRNA (adenosine(37)-N6)-dimethylallyltransferase MiaA [Longibacter salinarum]|uniref:tRNA dimethylallyltransferase n=1 Tax=Longibacter salinarum TaxID=1850348 RepID=A0A2A8D2M6_9BACT|nr:tRNA (adenosine(37)-N6)-dimethylallyltransferase MiaA [Longibacter salinarum]PEN15077.1 tRNA (adenosine(37)-N6)-dimethylallyltransferase MiaA [Longibacter salinarum]